MRNHAPISAVALDHYVEDLAALLYGCESDLPHARNGKPVASGDDYADSVLKEMRAGRSKEIRRLVAVLLAFLARGSKRTTVRLFAQRLDAILAAHGKTDEPRPIRYLNRRETREDGMFDLAQLRIEADPDDLESLEALVRQGAYFRQAVTDLMEEAQDRIVILRSAPASPSSARRLALVES